MQEKVVVYVGQDVFYGVCLEFVLILDLFFLDGCSGEMVCVENMGYEFFVYLKVVDYELIVRIFLEEVKLMIVKGFNCKVYFCFDMNKCYIFDVKIELNFFF